MAPAYDKLASLFSNSPDSDVVIAKIDAVEHATVAEKYGVDGFPTLKFFSVCTSILCRPADSALHAVSVQQCSCMP